MRVSQCSYCGVSFKVDKVTTPNPRLSGTAAPARGACALSVPCTGHPWMPSSQLLPGGPQTQGCSGGVSWGGGLQPATSSSDSAATGFAPASCPTPSTTARVPAGWGQLRDFLVTPSCAWLLHVLLQESLSLMPGWELGDLPTPGPGSSSVTWLVTLPKHLRGLGSVLSPGGAAVRKMAGFLHLHETLGLGQGTIPWGRHSAHHQPPSGAHWGSLEVA